MVSREHSHHHQPNGNNQVTTSISNTSSLIGLERCSNGKGSKCASGQSSKLSPSTIKRLTHCLQPNYSNLTLDKYFIVEPTEASSLYKCVNQNTSETHLCRVLESSKYQEYLSIYSKFQDNPAINKIHEICVGPSKTLIVFEQSFDDLHSHVRHKKRLTEGEARRLFHQITSIVADSHRKGIVLRDLKLRKFVFKDAQRTQLVLETWDDAVVLTDPDDDLLNDKHGCPTYVSPEILSKANHTYSGKLADCWSLGVILFTMLAGRYPFHDNNPTQLFSKIRQGTYNIPQTISPLAEFLIRSLLRKEPSERLTAEDLLHSNWFKVKDDSSELESQLPESQLSEITGSSSSSMMPSSSSSSSFTSQSSYPFSLPSSSSLPSTATTTIFNRSQQRYYSSGGAKIYGKARSTDQIVPDSTSPSNSEEDESFQYTFHQPIFP